MIYSLTNHQCTVYSLWKFYFSWKTSDLHITCRFYLSKSQISGFLFCFYLWGHWYPCFELLVMSPLGFKARVGSLFCTWWKHLCYMFPEIYLWCNTCSPPFKVNFCLITDSKYVTFLYFYGLQTALWPWTTLGHRGTHHDSCMHTKLMEDANGIFGGKNNSFSIS